MSESRNYIAHKWRQHDRCNHDQVKQHDAALADRVGAVVPAAGENHSQEQGNTHEQLNNKIKVCCERCPGSQESTRIQLSQNFRFQLHLLCLRKAMSQTQSQSFCLYSRLKRISSLHIRLQSRSKHSSRDQLFRIREISRGKTLERYNTEPKNSCQRYN